MSDRYGSQPPDDEPMIGAPEPPRIASPPLPRQPIIGGYAEEQEEDWEYADEPYNDEYGDDDDYYDDYYDDSPARQPMFYVFIALAAIVGGIFIFLLYSLVAGDGDDPQKTAADFKVIIDQPVPNDRIETGKDFTIAVRATATEAIALIELQVNGEPVDQYVPQSPPPTDLIYAASFSWRFGNKGEYKIAVKVTSESGATRLSEIVTVVAYEGVGERPVSVAGKVLASVSMRNGPGETYEVVGRLNPGQEVKVIGKTRDSEWLLIEEGGQRWVPRTAIELAESLALVPIKEPTPVPATPTSTSVASPSPSPSPSPTANPNTPDFAPTNAALTNGGTTLRVTVGNLSSNAFNGSLVVSVAGVGPGTLTQAFGVQIAANGNTIVEFELSPPVTTQKTAQVKVDPDNAIKEANEDNNAASFGLQPPLEQPDIAITGAQVTPAGITVTIKNNGGALSATTVTVRIKIGNAETAKSQELALAKNQSVTFTDIAKPGTGIATIEVVVGGQVMASAPLDIKP